MTTLQNTNTNINTNTNTNTNNNYQKHDNSVEYKYICIKKDLFDVNMVELNYKNSKQNRHIDIIYKSPSITLEGLFFKTPEISSNNIIVYHKDNNVNNITLKISLNQTVNPHFIQMMRSIDEYLSSYVNRNSIEINAEINSSDIIDSSIYENSCNNSYNNSYSYTNISMLKYEQIIKYNSYKSSIVNYSGEKIEIYQMFLKSYLDKKIINELEKQLFDKKYIFTFNITNIYFGNNTLIPLIKCNRCEVV